MLANYECDLHGHTNRSDGNDSPVEYIRHAVHRGVKILAITDHDIVPPEMIELGGGKDRRLRPTQKVLESNFSEELRFPVRHILMMYILSVLAVTGMPHILKN